MRIATADESKARSALDAAEKHERELQSRLEEQRLLHERNVNQLEAVRKQREATAAMTAAEITRRVIQDLEREVQIAVARVVELRARLKDCEQGRAALQESQAEQRAELQSEIAALEAEVGLARGKRNATAGGVPRVLLIKYDKLRNRRRETSVFAILGSSCGNCDMAVPIQRRNMMAATGSIEVCEACGVLLYITE
jgi:predicted  nucleic acid-binding Zn-ribbon protein